MELWSSASPGDRVEFETLLSGISAQLVAADSERLEEAVPSALEAVRAFFGADRCALCAITDDLQTVRFSHIVHSDGVSNLFGDLNLALLFPWVRQRVVVERHTLALARLADLPPEAAVDRGTFEARGTRSILCIPIQVAPARLDLILVSNVREETTWPEEYVPRLRLLGEMLVNSIERCQTTEREHQEAARLAAALEELHRLRDRLERENVYLQQEVNRRLGSPGIVGRSAAIRRTLALAEQVAPTDSTVLLVGETGSGKERFAAFIHESSRRRARPMVTVNCSAIPTALIESELFGREKGAYTGAFAKQVGRFELAHGSTLFLDEIGELPGEVQVKLLRVLETRTIERLGNPRPIAVDVRILAATHRDLAADVRAGRFREDLYYRLNVFPIVVPPLRDRREDIPLFVQTFIDELAGVMGRRIREVDPASVKGLTTYAWPGNVRELRNVVERAMILASGPILQIEAPAANATAGEAVQTSSRAPGPTEILKLLQECGWRIRGPYGAAVRLGLKPTTLESRIKKLGLTRP
jgi:formate hydrogenlyase transcriptional activator